MSTALELIRTVEANGGHFRVDGEDLVIAPRNAAEPVMKELRRLKPEIIELLARRPAMPAGIRLIRWAPKDAPIQVSPCSLVTDPEKFIRSTLRQVEARLSGKDWLAGWALSTLLDRLALCGCEVALDDPRKALQ
jgi:hypothetical protein